VLEVGSPRKKGRERNRNPAPPRALAGYATRTLTLKAVKKAEAALEKLCRSETT